MALMIFVNKNGVQMRMCINYCVLNRVTVKNNYALPKVADFLIDLKLENYQIQMVEENVHKIGMRIYYGSYEFLLIPLW